MSVGTLFTLFVVPTAYTFIARDHHADQARLGLDAAGPELPAHPHQTR